MSSLTQAPRVSVVMSVYDGARFLDEAVVSIRTQTFSNFEFIIVDDGSRDATREILCSHAREDSRVRVVVSRQNRGLIESLHRCFAEATGEFIARMDADDVAKPERLERQIEYLDSNPAIALVGSAVETIDAKSRVLKTVSVPSDPEVIRSHMRERGCVIFHPTVLVRRKTLEEFGRFRKAYQCAEDYDLWLRMLEKVQLANLDEVLLGYRRHEQSISYTKVRQQALSALCARSMARFRLRGYVDRTSELDLITDRVLRELGVSQDEINEAIFAHMIAVTDDVVRSGVLLAAAEFPQRARSYASSAQVKSATLKLNRRALRGAASPSERKRHRARLLATAPEVYWELFGSGSLSNRNGTDGNNAVFTKECGSEMRRPTLSEIRSRSGYITGKTEELLRDYDRLCGHLRDAPISLMEVGFTDIGSLFLWRDYFLHGEIVGVALFPPVRFTDPSDRIQIFSGDQAKPTAIDTVASVAGMDRFHIIIHSVLSDGSLCVATFDNLFHKHLKPGGFYVLEWFTQRCRQKNASSHDVDTLYLDDRHSQDSNGEQTLLDLMSELSASGSSAEFFLRPLRRTHENSIRSIHLARGLTIIEKSFD